jgi:hypothetical protein
MGNIWKLVRNPDRSICLAHIYEEEPTIIEITPTRSVLNELIWSFIKMLFIAQLLTIMAFAETIVFLPASVLMLAFSGSVLVTGNGEYTQFVVLLHKLYSMVVMTYSILFKDVCMFFVSVTYLVTYTIYFISLSCS